MVYKFTGIKQRITVHHRIKMTRSRSSSGKHMPNTQNTNRLCIASLLLGLILAPAFANTVFSNESQEKSERRQRSEFYHPDGTVVLESDVQDQVARNQYHA